MSSIIRRRRGLKSAISILLSEGWAPTPTSSQPGGDLRHLAPHAAAAASFNPLRFNSTPTRSSRLMAVLSMTGHWADRLLSRAEFHFPTVAKTVGFGLGRL